MKDKHKKKKCCGEVKPDITIQRIYKLMIEFFSENQVIKILILL